MIRIQRGTPAIISRVFYEDGVAVNPGTVTVTITASDGTLIAENAATTGAGTAARTYSVSATDTAQLDEWAVTWDSTAKGSLTDPYEIVGGFLFATTDLAAMKNSSTGTLGAAFTAAQLVAARTLVECALEDACNVAFVPRFRREVHDGTGGTRLMLDRPKVSAIRRVIVNGAEAAATVSEMGTLAISGRRFTAGFQNVVVEFEHGYLYAPPRVSQAGMLLARRWLNEGPVDDRATGYSNELGTYQLVTPGMRGALFDLPEVNAVVKRYEMNALVA